MKNIALSIMAAAAAILLVGSCSRTLRASSVMMVGPEMKEVSNPATDLLQMANMQLQFNAFADELKNKGIIVTVVDDSLERIRLKNKDNTPGFVLDTVNRLAYVCLSREVTEDAANAFCEDHGYISIPLHARGKYGSGISETDKVISIGSKVAVVCKEAISSPEELQLVEYALKRTKKEVMEISFDQAKNFAANMIELQDGNKNVYFVMSNSAYNSLSESQVKFLSKYGKIISADIHTIEKLTGQSVCSLIKQIN